VLLDQARLYHHGLCPCVLSLIWSTLSTDVAETMDTKIVMVNGASHSLKMVGSFEEVMQALAEE
jgi:hypothetical protein